MAITPPIFVRTDDLCVYASVADAEAHVEPVDVSPDDRAWDSEDRALSCAGAVLGEVRRGWLWVDQHRARVEIEETEAGATHAAQLYAELAAWLRSVEYAAAPGATFPGLSSGRGVT